LQVQTLQQQSNELKNTVQDHEDTILSAQENLQAQRSLNVDLNCHLQELTRQINDTQGQNEIQMQEYVFFNHPENIHHDQTLEEHLDVVRSLETFN